jgi:hypothetical protein
MQRLAREHGDEAGEQGRVRRTPPVLQLAVERAVALARAGVVGMDLSFAATESAHGARGK